MFDRHQGHEGITFDEGTPQLTLRHKRLFQCLPYSIVVKKSATEFNKSDVMLSGIRIIVTTNTWRELLALCTESEKRLLGKNANVVDVKRPLFRAGELVHA